MSYESLFSPFIYKGLHLKNRFVMAPMTRMFSPDGIPGQNVADYYARRAEAEVGLILTEGTVIERPASKNAKDIPDFYGNNALGGWKNVVDAVHAHKGAIAPQIWHVGDVKATDWVPPGPKESPNSMTTEDIETTIKAFAASAKYAKDLGFDAVEVHGAHGYLIDQFFWEQTNQRTDEFGGTTIKDRGRFGVEVIKAIRAAVGDDFTILMRLSQWKQQDYSVKLAPTPHDLENWVQPLAEAGVDIFHASQRRFWEAEFDGSDLNFAGWVKKVTGQPTITVGSVGLSNDMTATFARGEGANVTDLSELTRRFERGDFDLVAVGRSILQDPEWVKKIKDSQFDELQAFEAKSMSTLY